MAFSAFAFLLASLRKHCLALAMATTLDLLGRGETGLGVGREGRAKEDEGTRVGVSKISISDDGMVVVG